jgi:hypothetical protein
MLLIGIFVVSDSLPDSGASKILQALGGHLNLSFDLNTFINSVVLIGISWFA